MNLYVTSYGSKVGLSGGKIQITCENSNKDYPIEMIERISLGPGVSITSPAIIALAEGKKSVFWLSTTGKTYASIVNPDKDRLERQKRQFILSDDQYFMREMAKRIVERKIRTELTGIEQLYAENNLAPESAKIGQLHAFLVGIQHAGSVDTAEGIEGYSAKIYYSLLKPLVPYEFGFTKRTKHPPMDCFSAAISFMYTLLYNDISVAIQAAGLCPYVGIMHKLKDTHCALASDLMEEFRTELCDMRVIKLINDGILTPDDFVFNDDGTVYLAKQTTKMFIAEYENYVNTKTECSLGNGRGSTYRDIFAARVYEYIDAITNYDEKLFIKNLESGG